METKEHSGKFTFESPINLETSFNVTPISDNAKSEIEVTINSDGKGYFDWEVESEDINESGGLWFEENELVDYDGVFELPAQLIEYLEKQGYNMDYVK